MAPNLLARYFYAWEPTVVQQTIETARTSVSSGGHSSSYKYQQRRLSYEHSQTCPYLPDERGNGDDDCDRYDGDDCPKWAGAGEANCSYSGVGLFQSIRHPVPSVPAGVRVPQLSRAFSQVFQNQGETAHQCHWTPHTSLWGRVSF